MRALYKFLLYHFRGVESLDILAKPAAAVLTLAVILIIAWLAYYITRKFIIRFVQRIARKTKTSWDDILVKHRVFNGLAHLVPAFILYYTCNFASPGFHQSLNDLSPDVLELLSKDYYFWLGAIILKFVKVYFAAIIVYVVNTILNAGNEIYNTMPYSHHRPIKGYIQLLKILLFFLAGIMAISILLDKDPTVLLAGLGALAAVLLLVFKDTILGLVASIQLSANEMVRIGDWIEMPGHNADGTVLDITLNTVKVKNWDNTIATIPTYALVSESFNNWRGMEESGGRRIKRSVSINMSTIRFCNYDLVKKFQKFDLIRDYVIQKQAEIDRYNKEKGIADHDRISGRRQTNIGIFRKYLEVYLKNHPMINNDMTFLVRQLQHTEKGLPIEIYVFCKDKAWANYESIQSDIFDHIFAVIPEFDLSVFQAPSGEDIKSLGKGGN